LSVEWNRDGVMYCKSCGDDDDDDDELKDLLSNSTGNHKQLTS